MNSRKITLPAERPATHKQLAYLTSLLDRVDVDIEGFCDYHLCKLPSELTVAEAGEFLGRLVPRRPRW